MTKTALSYLKVAAIVAVLGIALTQSINPSSAGTLLPPANPLPDVDIASELQTLDSFANDWGKFEKKRAELRKKSSLTSSEFQLLNDDHGALKRRLSQVPNAIRTIINKLKAAGKWDTLDEDLLAASTTDDKFKASLREFGGARKLFEDGASQLGGAAAATEILGSLDDVQKKVARQEPDGLQWRTQESELRLVAAAYHPVTPLFARSAGCVFATIGRAAKMIVHPFQHVASPTYACKCHDVCGDGST
jgi:hypothetical protein